MKRFFIGACLMAFALGAQAQSYTYNGDFRTGSSADVTLRSAQSLMPSGVAGWDIVSGNGQVFTQQVNIGASGPGDTSLVVYDEGQNGGVSQTVQADSPYLYVSADVYVQYGTAYLSSSNPVDGTTVAASTNQTGRWITLSGVVPNQGAGYGQAAVVQILSGDPNGSAFAVDNVAVQPAEGPQNGITSPAYVPNSIYDSGDGYYPPAWTPPVWSGGYPTPGMTPSLYVEPTSGMGTYVLPTAPTPDLANPSYTDYNGYVPSVPTGYYPSVPIGQIPTLPMGQIPTMPIGQLPTYGTYAPVYVAPTLPWGYGYYGQ